MRLWYKFEGRYLWKNFKSGVKNLIKWFPIVWRDRDWDYSFIFQNLKFKLQETGKYIESKKRFEGWEFVVRDINICIKLIDRIDSDFYETEYIDYKEDKYDFIPIEGKPDFKELKITNIWENLDDYFKKYPRQFKKFNITKDKNRIAINISRSNHKRALKLLFKILGERIETFWD